MTVCNKLHSSAVFCTWSQCVINWCKPKKKTKMFQHFLFLSNLIITNIRFTNKFFFLKVLYKMFAHNWLDRCCRGGTLTEFKNSRFHGTPDSKVLFYSHFFLIQEKSSTAYLSQSAVFWHKGVQNNTDTDLIGKKVFFLEEEDSWTYDNTRVKLEKRIGPRAAGHWREEVSPSLQPSTQALKVQSSLNLQRSPFRNLTVL